MSYSYTGMQVTYPYTSTSARLLAPRPGEESRIFAVFKPFDPMVWLCFVVSFFTMVFFLGLFSWIIDRRNHIEQKLSSYLSFSFVYVSSSVTNQGNWTRNTCFSFRTLAGVWLLATIVLLYSYSGILISALTVPKMKPPINSLQDLAGNSEVFLALHDKTVFVQRFLTATTGVYKLLGDQLKQHPERQYSNENEKNAIIAANRYVIAETETSVFYLLGRDFNINRTCPYTASPGLYTTYISFGLKQGGKYNSRINQAVLLSWETGLFNFWVKRVLPAYEYCLAKQNPTAAKRPIKLQDLASAFVILGVGWLLSAGCFLFELVSKRWF